MCWCWLGQGDGSPPPPKKNRYQISKKHLISNTYFYILEFFSLTCTFSCISKQKMPTINFSYYHKMSRNPQFATSTISCLMSLNNLEVMFILDCMACFTPANTKLPNIEHLLNVSVFNVSNPQPTQTLSKQPMMISSIHWSEYIIHIRINFL